jgi:putative Mg2+ transporter-C (MgtC) family protein
MKHLFLLFLPPIFADLLSRTLARLMLAAILGGIIGLERELKHRPAGLRTNMFICFGAAMFTVISLELGGANDATRIASQIIPGIGFIGAGSILRDKGGVTGLTTAATIFVVASIGMACGGGLYLPAVFATMLLLLALLILGALEGRLNLKPVMMEYVIVSDKSPDVVVSEINKALEEQSRELSSMHLIKLNGKEKIVFSVAATRKEHKELLDCLHQSEDLRNLKTEPGIEIE